MDTDGKTMRKEIRKRRGVFEIKKNRNRCPPPLSNRPCGFCDFEIHYNRDLSLNHIVRNKHSYYEFYFLISGDVTYYIEDREFDLKPGVIILIATGAVPSGHDQYPDGTGV